MSMLGTGAEAPLGRWSMTRPLLRDLFWKVWKDLQVLTASLYLALKQGLGGARVRVGKRHNRPLP